MQTGSINDSMGSAAGGGGGGGEADTMGFGSQEQYSSALHLAQDASSETGGGIAAHKRQGSYYRARPPQWLDSAMTELSWPAVPGGDGLTLPAGGPVGQAAPTPSGQYYWRHDPRGWNKDTKMPKNLDLRTDYAKQFLAEQGTYAPPSEHKFRDEADPVGHGEHTAAVEALHRDCSCKP